MHRPARQNPTHVRPDPAIARRMRITFLIGILMVHAMRRHPGDRAAFEGQSSANGEEVFHPFRCLVAPMREQPVVAHADAKTPNNPRKQYRQRKRLPSEEKQGYDPTDVECCYEGAGHPIDGLCKCSVAFKDAHGPVVLCSPLLAIPTT